MENRRTFAWLCRSHAAIQWANSIPQARRALRQEPAKDARRCTWPGCTTTAVVALVDNGFIAAVRKVVEMMVGRALDEIAAPPRGDRRWQ